MEMYMIGFLVGILTAVIALTVFYVISKNKDKFNKKIKASYDERQKKARGEAAKVGFIISLVCSAVLLVFEFILTYKQISFNFIIPIIFTIFIPLTVFGCVCVWKDAWLSLKDSPKTIIISTSFVALFNYFIGISNYISLKKLFSQEIKLIDSLNMEKLFNGLPYNSVYFEPNVLQLYMPFLNIICALAILIILVNYLIKLAVDKSREKREIDEES